MPFRSMSVNSLIRRATHALNAGNINLTLALVHDFVERIITEPICTAKVFSSNDIDQLCLRIGRLNLTKLNVAEIRHQRKLKDVKIVAYIVSRLQRSGGHSRLVQDFIHSQPEKYHLILSTEVGGASDTNYFLKVFAEDNNVCLLRAPLKSFEARLRWMQATLLTYMPDHIYLFNHHQDSVAVSALVPELNLKGSFCHHGDHHICLGVHFTHLTHIDFHPMGYHYCRDKLGISNRYLPLTFEDKKLIPYQTEFMGGGALTTATAARSNKIEIPYYVSYLDIISRLLNATGGRHIHIGKLTPWALRQIYSQMRKHGVNISRFIYIDWTSSVWKTLQEYKVDIYIASFPYGAGLTLVEAMGAGIPVIMHQHMFSRVLSGLELAYNDAFRWSNPEALLKHLETVTKEQLASERLLSRQHYLKYHTPDILRSFLKQPSSFRDEVPGLSPDFRPRLDEWAAWAQSQSNLSGLLRKAIFRQFRRFRRHYLSYISWG